MIIESTPTDSKSSSQSDFYFNNSFCITNADSTIFNTNIVMGDMYTRYTYTQFCNYIDLEDKGISKSPSKKKQLPDFLSDINEFCE